ncbi:hypothetical protein, partial [Bacillus sp. SIMBA_005]
MNASRSHRARTRGLFAAALSALLLTAAALGSTAPATADTMPPDPTNPASPPTVGATALPTVQMDGVAWSQTVVGDTV